MARIQKFKYPFGVVSGALMPPTGQAQDTEGILISINL